MIVCCDVCGADEHLELSSLDERALESALRGVGWERRDHYHWCDDCIAQDEADEAAEGEDDEEDEEDEEELSDGLH